ncbi:hypothetical protein [Stutzerimonas stutzeri]|uniref:hypothetical protein n=1 Tax=Stutzerimonas stutzeri TaxID=316 RepID=UPI00147B3661|nr:hypothetical protein [Stutzerimonas stutzeri]WRQ01521.1 hypothetical protein U3Q39_013215 [Stutzerimonas stutzeri]
MYFLKSGVLVLLALLVGCDSEQRQSSSVDVDQSSSVQVFQKSAIALNELEMLDIDGQIVRYDLVRKGRGTTDRYVIESSRTLMGLESEVFANLARRGYVRHVRQESPERLLVVYKRKGTPPTIVADYRAKKNSHALARLTISIRAEG